MSMVNRVPDSSGPSRSAWLAPVLAAGALAAAAASTAASLRPAALIVALTLGTGATVLAATHALADRNSRLRAAVEERGTDTALAAARAEARLLERILDTTEEGVLLVDAGARVQLANAAAQRILGLGRARSTVLEAIGLPSIIARSVAEGGVLSEEHQVYLPSRRLIAVRAMPFEQGGLVLVSDVTDERRLETVRKDFAANVSHELKTPVSGISLLAEQLVHAIHEDPEAAARFAGQLLTEAERLGNLVRDLLDLSRIESDLPLVSGDADALALAAEAVERVRTIADAKGITLTLSGAPVAFRADAAQIGTALANLLDNAVRYSPSGSEVRMSVERAAGAVAFVVVDNGPGIPSSEIGRIFERFYRVDKARARATGGTGLGLAIVKHVAERHGGTVEATSDLGRGSRFTLTVPLKHEEPA